MSYSINSFDHTKGNIYLGLNLFLKICILRFKHLIMFSLSFYFTFRPILLKIEKNSSLPFNIDQFTSLAFITIMYEIYKYFKFEIRPIRNKNGHSQFRIS